MKLLPEKNELKKKMEEQEPGIFERLSEELIEYFEEVEEGDVQTKPEKVTDKDEAAQLSRYKKVQKKTKLSSDHFDKFTDADLVEEGTKGGTRGGKKK